MKPEEERRIIREMKLASYEGLIPQAKPVLDYTCWPKETYKKVQRSTARNEMYWDRELPDEIPKQESLGFYLKKHSEKK